MTRLTTDVGPWAIVPAWVLDTAVSDRAVKLYAVLGLYANQEGTCWPSRRTLATRVGCSLDSLDRAKHELVNVGALEWEQQTEAGGLTSNRYTLRYAVPGVAAPLRLGSRATEARGSRVSAAKNKSQLELDPATQGSTADGGAPDASIPNLVGMYVEDVRAVEAGHTPTRQWKAAAGRAIKVALDNGEEPVVIRQCLGIAAREGKNPATLAHIISDYHAKRPRRKT